MKTKTINIYSFDELSEKAKEKAQNHFGEHHADFETDNLEDDFTEQLKEDYPFFINPKFQWSLGYCQGDGLSFSCDYIDLNIYLEKYYPNMKTSVFDALCNAIYNFKSNGNNGHYCYASKSDIDYEYNYYKEYKHINNLLDKIVDEIREIYIDICKKFENQGYEAYSYLYTEEYAKDTCEANVYEFDEEGNII